MGGAYHWMTEIVCVSISTREGIRMRIGPHYPPPTSTKAVHYLVSSTNYLTEDGGDDYEVLLIILIISWGRRGGIRYFCLAQYIPTRHLLL